MFGTLRIGRTNNEAQFIDRTGSVLGDAAMQRIACDFCRSKKLKCSGQRSGCDRCKAVGYPCIYSPAAHGRDARKLNKRGISASRKAIKRRGLTQHVEQPDSDQVLPSRNYSNSYEHGLAYNLKRINSQEGNKQQENNEIRDMTNILDDSGIEILTPVSTDFREEIKTLHGSQMSPMAEFLDSSIGAGDSWASFATIIGDTYLANPVGVVYEGIEYDNTSYDNVFPSPSSSSFFSDTFMQQEPIVLTSTNPNIKTSI